MSIRDYVNLPFAWPALFPRYFFVYALRLGQRTWFARRRQFIQFFRYRYVRLDVEHEFDW